MHEMALAESILELVEETAQREHASRVRLVVLDIGALSSVEPEALAFCFEAVIRDTIAQGAALEIARVPGEGWCLACAKPQPMTELFSACPACGSYQMQVTSGTDMRVREIEID